MRRSVLPLVGLVLAACTSVVQGTSTTIEPPETTVASSVGPSAPGVEVDQLSGRLPDGREYELELDVQLGDQEPFYVDAPIEVNMEQAPFTGDEIGCPTCTQPVLGVSTFYLESGHDPSFIDRVYRASSGDWTMDIAIYPEIVSAWGADIEEALLDHIRPVDVGAGLRRSNFRVRFFGRKMSTCPHTWRSRIPFAVLSRLR